MIRYFKNKSFVYLFVNIVLTIFIIPLQTNNIISGIFCILFSILAYKMFNTNFNLFQIMILFIYIVVGSQLAIKNLYYFYILLLFLFFYLLVMFFRDKKQFLNIYYKKHLKIFLIVIIYLLFASLFLVKDMNVGFTYGKYHIAMVFVFFVFFCNIRYYAYNKKIFIFLKIVLIAILVLGFIQIFGFNIGLKSFFIDYPFDPLIEPFKKYIPTVFFYNPNNYGMFLVSSLFFILGDFLYNKSKKQKIINFIIINVIYFQLIMTMSRISFIASLLILIFAFILFIAKTRKNYKKYIRFMCLIISLSIIIISFMVFPFLKGYLSKFDKNQDIILENIIEQQNDDISSTNDEQLNSGNVRLNLIFNVLDGVIKEKNFLGLGIGEVYQYILSKNNTGKIYNIHSFHFEILGAYGIFIFIIYFVFMVYIFIRFILIYMKTKYLKGIIFSSFLIFTSFMITCFAPSTVLNNSLFFMMLGSAMGCCYIKIPSLSLNKNIKVENI